MLKGKTFILTQADSKKSKVKKKLLELGAKVFDFPTIQIRETENTPEILKVYENLSYDWIIFTSKNGVKYFFDKLYDYCSSYIMNPKIKYAAIGKRTAYELLKYNIEPSYINTGNTSEDFLSELKSLIKKDDKILLPLGNLAKNKLKKGLDKVADVTRIDVYETVKPESIKFEVINEINTQNYDWIIFMSPSAFNNFLEITKGKLNHRISKIACIGNTTEKSIIKKKYIPLLTSSKSNVDVMIKEIIEYNNKKINTI